VDQLREYSPDELDVDREKQRLLAEGVGQEGSVEPL